MNYFQDFYQYCISLSCSDFTIDSIAGDPELSLVFTYSDKSKGQTTVDFRKASESKYEYSISGTPMGKVSASSLNKLLKYLEKVLKDEPIK